MQWRRYVPTILDNLIWIILAGVFIFFVIGSDRFLTPINIVNILSAAAVLGVVAVGQTFVLITGNFDLSPGVHAGPLRAGRAVDHGAHRGALVRRRLRRSGHPVHRAHARRWAWSSAT